MVKAPREKALRAAIESLEEILTTRSVVGFERVAAEVFIELSPEETCDALSTVFSCAFAEVENLTRALESLRPVARHLAEYTDADLEVILIDEVFAKKHYYIHLSNVAWAFEQAVHVVFDAKTGDEDIWQGAYQSVGQAVTALYGLAWSFDEPDTYAAWWASAEHALDDAIGPCPSGAVIEYREEHYAGSMRVIESFQEYVTSLLRANPGDEETG